MSNPSTNTTTGSVASRFVSSTELEAAATKRKEEWAAAYARIGQEPPKLESEEEKYDPRSLWEKLQENKSKKQEAFEEQLKFKNHFRALDEEEISFLDSMIDENNDEEKERQRMIKEELQNFRKAVTAKSVPLPPPAILTSTSASLLEANLIATTSKLSPTALTSTTSTTITTASPLPSLVTTNKSGKPIGNGKGKASMGGKKVKSLPGLVIKPKTKASKTEKEKEKEKEQEKPTPSPSPSPALSTPLAVSGKNSGLAEAAKGQEGSDQQTVRPADGDSKKRTAGQTADVEGRVDEEGKKRKVETVEANSLN